jgi:hypothetical protein
VASTAAGNRGYEKPGNRSLADVPGGRGAFAPDPATGTEAGPGPTTPRRSAVRRASRLRGRAHASQAWRRALLARHVSRLDVSRRSANPLARGSAATKVKRKEENPDAKMFRERRNERESFVGWVERLRETHRRRCPRWARRWISLSLNPSYERHTRECENPGAATRSGTKKTALFDIVNRKRCGAMHRQVPDRHRVSGNALVSRPSARLGAPRRALLHEAGSRASGAAPRCQFRPHPEEAAKPPSRRRGRPRLWPSCFETPRIARKPAQVASTCLRCAAPQHEGERAIAAAVRGPGLARDTRAEHDRGRVLVRRCVHKRPPHQPAHANFPALSRLKAEVMT